MSPRAIADDPWNPFAEQDKRPVRSPHDRQPPASRGGYLAPITPADTTRMAPYPERVRRGEVPFTPNGRPPPVTPYFPGPSSPGSSSPFDSRPDTYQPPSVGENWAPEAITAGTAVERGELSPVMNGTAASPAGFFGPALTHLLRNSSSHPSDCHRPRRP